MPATPIQLQVNALLTQMNNPAPAGFVFAVMNPFCLLTFRNIVQKPISMRIPRIFHSGAIVLDGELQLDDDAANHVGRVLRMPIGAELVLFNGDGFNYAARITASDKKRVHVTVTQRQPNPVESPVSIHLGQGISRGDRMDFAIQKAVELGVTEITPLFTERCGVKLDGERLAKRSEELDLREANVATTERRIAEELVGLSRSPASKTRPKRGRNDPCWCGSGKKYKMCHLPLDS